MEQKLTNVVAKPIIRVFDAPCTKVWKAWTDPEYIKRWWGPKDFTAPYVSNDFRVGGKYIYDMRGAGPDGVERDYWNTGKYLEIVPMEKIVATTSFADKNGNAVPASYYGMPGEWPMETKLTVIFEDTEDGKTKVTIWEEGVPNEMIEDSRLGWEQSLDKFAKSLK
ncbi:MAG: SRPBCC family protein [Chloroflexota bacterium]